MEKKQVVRNLEEIARYLELDDPSNRFRALAYERAAGIVEGLDVSLEEFIRGGGIGRTEGIGKATGEVIREMVEQGRSTLLDELRSRYPSGILDLVRVPGLGMKKIALLYETLGIASIDDLAQALDEGTVASLPGFGSRTEVKLREGLEQLRKSRGQLLLPHALEVAERLASRIGALDEVEEAVVTGAIRRRLEVVDAIEILASAGDPPAAISAIVGLDLPERLEADGEQRVRGESKRGVVVEITLVEPPELPARLLFSTGSSSFLEALTARAREQGLELTPEHLTKDGKHLKVRTEDEVLRKLLSATVAPELRESAKWLKKPPRRLIELPDLRGTFHVHTTWSDGRHSLGQMVQAAETVGFSYVGISDHSKTASYAGGLSEQRVDEQQAEIDAASRNAGIRLFKGTECDILPSGEMDYDVRTLAKFDFVIASVHSQFKMAEDEMTERIVRAMRNPFVTILGHLTGRLLLGRTGYTVEFDRIFEVAAEEGVMIEINGNPRRAELDWRLIGRAQQRGVVFSINPDAHSIEEMARMMSGIWVARKGALSARHVFNTRGPEEVAEFLEKRRSRAMKRMRPE